MQLGMIGLGRMGANMVRRLVRAGHQCVVYNRSPGPVKELAAEGAIGATSIEDFVRRPPPGQTEFRVNSRRKLLTELDAIQEKVESASTITHDTAYQRAFSLISSPDTSPSASATPRAEAPRERAIDFSVSRVAVAARKISWPKRSARSALAALKATMSVIVRILVSVAHSRR